MSVHYVRVEDSGFKTFFFNWLKKMECFVFALLCLVFIFASGAGWGINQCNKSHEIKQHVKIVKYKRHR